MLAASSEGCSLKIGQNEKTSRNRHVLSPPSFVFRLSSLNKTLGVALEMRPSLVF
jgi:hypothetical protein